MGGKLFVGGCAMGLEGRIVGGQRPYDGVVGVCRNRMERAGFVWVGHILCDAFDFELLYARLTSRLSKRPVEI